MVNESLFVALLIIVIQSVFVSHLSKCHLQKFMNYFCDKQIVK
jgi:hypothetical protein